MNIHAFIAAYPASGFVAPSFCPPPTPPAPPPIPAGGGGSTPAPTGTPPPSSAVPPPPPPPPVYTGDDHDTGPPPKDEPPPPPPAEGCGSPAAKPVVTLLPTLPPYEYPKFTGAGQYGGGGAGNGTDGGSYSSRYGHEYEDGLLMPAIGHFVALGRYGDTKTRQGDTLVLQENPVYTQQALLEYDQAGRLKTYHPATGPGYMMFGPAELQPHLFYGDNTNHSPRPGAALPKRISLTGLGILSFQRNNTAHGESPDGFIGLGVAHPTGLYVADGWVNYLSGNAGARQLNIRPTDYSGALTTGQTLKIWGNLEVTGTTTGVSEWTEEVISTAGAGAGSFTDIALAAAKGQLLYVEMVAYNGTDVASFAAEGLYQITNQTLTHTLRETVSDFGSYVLSVGAGVASIAVTNTGTASDNTCWKLRYRLVSQDNAC